jgi:hypothetical protein
MSKKTTGSPGQNSKKRSLSSWKPALVPPPENIQEIGPLYCYKDAILVLYNAWFEGPLAELKHLCDFSKNSPLRDCQSLNRGKEEAEWVHGLLCGYGDRPTDGKRDGEPVSEKEAAWLQAFTKLIQWLRSHEGLTWYRRIKSGSPLCLDVIYKTDEWALPSLGLLHSGAFDGFVSYLLRDAAPDVYFIAKDIKTLSKELNQIDAKPSGRGKGALRKAIERGIDALQVECSNDELAQWICKNVPKYQEDLVKRNKKKQPWRHVFGSWEGFKKRASEVRCVRNEKSCSK